MDFDINLILEYYEKQYNELNRKFIIENLQNIYNHKQIEDYKKEINDLQEQIENLVSNLRSLRKEDDK